MTMMRIDGDALMAAVRRRAMEECADIADQMAEQFRIEYGGPSAAGDTSIALRDLILKAAALPPKPETTAPANDSAASR